MEPIIIFPWQSTNEAILITISTPLAIPNVNTSVNITGTTTIVLVRGNTGSAVKELQENLISLGYSCGKHGADGSYGADTEAAVRKFQSEYENGLSVDGIAGYQTLTAIQSALNDKYIKVKVTASLLNVRSGAGMNYSIVSTVRKNTICKMTEEKDGWAKIISPSGWISMQYIEKINWLNE